MFTFGLVMLFCIVQSSSALKCYTCESVSNPRCADIKDKGFQPQDCIVENVLAQGAGFFGQFGLGNNANNKEPLVPTCLKVVTRNGTGNVVARRCAVKSQSQDPCSLARNTGHQTGITTQFEFCGTCETDACNSGNSMQLFATMIVFGAMVCTARLFV